MRNGRGGRTRRRSPQENEDREHPFRNTGPDFFEVKREESRVVHLSVEHSGHKAAER